MTKPTVNPERVAEAIEALERYFDNDEIGALLEALEALREQPHESLQLDRLSLAFNQLGINCGAVLNYAPYVGILLADNPFGDE